MPRDVFTYRTSLSSRQRFPMAPPNAPLAFARSGSSATCLPGGNQALIEPCKIAPSPSPLPPGGEGRNRTAKNPHWAVARSLVLAADCPTGYQPVMGEGAPCSESIEHGGEGVPVS